MGSGSRCRDGTILHGVVSFRASARFITLRAAGSRPTGACRNPRRRPPVAGSCRLPRVRHAGPRFPPLPLVAPLDGARGKGERWGATPPLFYRLRPPAFTGAWGLLPPRSSGWHSPALWSRQAGCAAPNSRDAPRLTLPSLRGMLSPPPAAFSLWSSAAPVSAGRLPRGSSDTVGGFPN